MNIPDELKPGPGWGWASRCPSSRTARLPAAMPSSYQATCHLRVRLNRLLDLTPQPIRHTRQALHFSCSSPLSDCSNDAHDNDAS